MTNLDWNNNYGNEKDKCILFHCGPVPQSMMKEKGQVVDHELLVPALGKGCSWGCNVGRIKPMEMTYCGMKTMNGKLQFYIGEGKITEDVIPGNFFGCAGVAEIENLQHVLQTIGTAGHRHHTVIVEGYVADAVQEALEKYIGAEVVTIMSKTIDCIVAGHTCMDLIPTFLEGGTSIEEILQPGKLIQVGDLEQVLGGVVPNTAGALSRLGLSVCPMGKTGNDLLGKSILEKMKAEGLPTKGMITDDACTTSYTIVLNIPGIDRIPLHSPGANDTFDKNDLDYEIIRQARHFHFGYPPLMRSLFIDGGTQLAEIFERVQQLGVRTSLDMARPDPQTEAGKADWQSLLKKVLPFVNLFTPSIDELLYMMDRSAFNDFVGSDEPLGGLTEHDLQSLGSKLLTMGTKEVLIKLGEFGAYYISEKESFYTPCFQVELKGAIGSGDCTIAGFLAARLKGLPIKEALTIAVATGACNVEAMDSLSGNSVGSLAETNNKWMETTYSIVLNSIKN